MASLLLESKSSSNDLLRRSYSMPTSSREGTSSPVVGLVSSIADVRTSKSEDIATTNSGDKSSNHRHNNKHGHKLDRYGFILNMDSQGNTIGKNNSGVDDNNGNHHNSPMMAGTGGAGVGNNVSQLPSTNVDASCNIPPTTAEAARTARRVQKWEAMLANWQKTNTATTTTAGKKKTSNSNGFAGQRRRRLVKRRLRKGIPDSQRAIVWPVLCNVEEQLKKYPGLYRELVEKSVGGGAGGAAAATPTATTMTKNAASATNGNGNGATTSNDGRGKLKSKKEVAAAAAVAVESHHQSKQQQQSNVPFHHSKSFKNIQDTIERDIHRTFPRHSLFYSDLDENGADDDYDDNNNIHNESAEDNSSADTATDIFLQKGICGTNEISSMIQELELAQRKKHQVNVDDTALAQDNIEMCNNGNTNHLIHSGNANGDMVNQTKILEGAGGQSRLRRVLKAYSTYDREIGYCQGMNFIAAMFLTLVTEEQAFWMLVFVMYDKPCRMRGLFGEGMRETHQVLYVSEKLIHQFLPRLSNHLDRETIHVTMFATQWLLTQYTSSFRFDLVYRLWDCFLFEGWKITYRVMLSLLQHSQNALLTMSFEEILAYFRELPERPDIGGIIIDEAIKIPLRTIHIVKHEMDWRAQQQQHESS